MGLLGPYALLDVGVDVFPVAEIKFNAAEPDYIGQVFSDLVDKLLPVFGQNHRFLTGFVHRLSFVSDFRQSLRRQGDDLRPQNHLRVLQCCAVPGISDQRGHHGLRDAQMIRHRYRFCLLLEGRLRRFLSGNWICGWNRSMGCLLCHGVAFHRVGIWVAGTSGPTAAVIANCSNFLRISSFMVFGSPHV